jgi:ATP-dependent RNA helicase MSS116
MQAWQSWLGFYNSHLKLLGWDKSTLVAQANFFSPVLGLDDPPALLRKTIGMMGLKGVAGLKVLVDDAPGGGQRGGGGGPRGGHGGHQPGGRNGAQGDGLFRNRHTEQQRKKPTTSESPMGGHGHGHGGKKRGGGHRH